MSNVCGQKSLSSQYCDKYQEPNGCSEPSDVLPIKQISLMAVKAYLVLIFRGQICISALNLCFHLEGSTPYWFLGTIAYLMIDVWTFYDFHLDQEHKFKIVTSEHASEGVLFNLKIRK